MKGVLDAIQRMSGRKLGADGYPGFACPIRPRFAEVCWIFIISSSALAIVCQMTTASASAGAQFDDSRNGKGDLRMDWKSSSTFLFSRGGCLLKKILENMGARLWSLSRMFWVLSYSLFVSIASYGYHGSSNDKNAFNIWFGLLDGLGHICRQARHRGCRFPDHFTNWKCSISLWFLFYRSVATC